MIFEKWEEILKLHFAPIPAIKVEVSHNITSSLSSKKNGVLKMRHNPESNIEHTHVYVQRGMKQGADQPYDFLLVD